MPCPAMSRSPARSPTPWTQRYPARPKPRRSAESACGYRAHGPDSSLSSLLRHLGRGLLEWHHTTAVLFNERLGRRLFAECDGLRASHAADTITLDHVDRLLGEDPVVVTRLLPARRLAHIVDVDGCDVLRLFGQLEECEGVAHRREPDRLVRAFQENLPLRSGMLCQQHSAVMPRRIG